MTRKELTNFLTILEVTVEYEEQFRARYMLEWLADDHKRQTAEIDRLQHAIINRFISDNTPSLQN